MAEKQVVAALMQEQNPAKAIVLSSFFKTKKGEYGEGDIFIGVQIPVVRQIVKAHAKDCSILDIEKLIYNPIHEIRMCGWLIFQDHYRKTHANEKPQLISFLIKHKSQLNNWDFVDSIIPKTLGVHIKDKPEEKQILYAYIQSSNIWDRRIAILATYPLIKSGDFNDIFELTILSLKDTHDLIHKACGWMLREVGKKDEIMLKKFLDQHASNMPRTMLRYAIERLDEFDKKEYMRKKPE
jgi:3-methyladenine DNA glycosylase AlkD